VIKALALTSSYSTLGQLIKCNLDSPLGVCLSLPIFERVLSS
jgi:hypothetical protein